MVQSPDVRLVTEARYPTLFDEIGVRQMLPVVPSDTNLDTIQARTEVGARRLPIPASSNIQNAPPGLRSTALFEMWRGDFLDTAVQRVTTRTNMYWRRAIGDGVWGEWQQAGGDAQMSLTAQAARDEWDALYDPTNLESIDFNPDGTILRIRDSLGNFPPLVATAAQSVRLVRGAFGQANGVDGPMFVTLEADLAQPASVMVLARDSGKTSTSNRSLIGTGNSAKRFAMRLNTEGKAVLGVGAQTRTGNLDAYQAGTHVWEGFFQATNSTLSIDGALAHRGMPASGTEGVAGLYVGALFVSGGTVTNPWGGVWGAVAIRAGSNDAGRDAINQMRGRLMSIAGLQPAKPWLWPEIRALSLDSGGRERVVVGDPDEMLSGAVASITKLLNAIVAREYLTTNTLLDTAVTVLPEDEFLIGNAPNLVRDDVATYRVLLQSMLIPSNNVAPRTIARTVGEMMPGAGGGQAKFIARMNAWLQEQGYTWAYVSSNPGGGGRFTMRQIAQLMLKAMEDPLLAGILGTERITVSITGPNARTVEIVNSWSTRQVYGTNIPEWVASKDGTGTTDVGTVFVWTHPDGTRHVTVVQSSALGAPGRVIAFTNNMIIEADKNGSYFQPVTPAAAFRVSGRPIVEPPEGWT